MRIWSAGIAVILTEMNARAFSMENAARILVTHQSLKLFPKYINVLTININHSTTSKNIL